MKAALKIATALIATVLSTTAAAGGILDSGNLNGNEQLNQRAATIVMGSAYLMDRKDVDTLKFNVCSLTRNERVYAIKLKVSHFAAEIDRVEVTYMNGDVEYLSVRDYFLPGSESRWINLAGGDRCIKRIKVWGDAQTLVGSNLRQSKVTFIGLTF